MSDKPENPPAFPHVKIPRGPSLSETFTDGGMTLRDYFASSALQGLISAFSGDEFTRYITDQARQGIAIHSYQLADAMLKARMS